MKATVAILEPHPKIRPLLSELLTTLGYRILFHAEKFIDFIQLIDKEHLPEVCIIDTNHRDMKGFDCSQ